MAKSTKKSKSGADQPILQHPLRFDSPELLAALDSKAAADRQSRNSTILTILEKALRHEGYLGGGKG